MAQKLSSIPPMPMGVRAPLSMAQRRLWFLYQLDPQSPEYNISRAWRLKGSLNTQALETSLNLILTRHDALRTIFQEIDGQPVQVIQPTLTAPFQKRDCSSFSPAQLEAEIDRFLIEEPLKPFDLLTGPLLRFTLMRCGPDDHVLVFTVHHMVFDGSSLKNFCQELSRCYAATLAGQPSPLAPLPIQYQDFSYWQQDHVTVEKLGVQLAFWTQQLYGAPLVLDLPSDCTRPKDNSGPGTYQAFTLAPQVISNLKQLIQPQGITMFMALLAVFQILLTRYTGQRDILVGTPIAGRTHTDVEDLMGFFVNTLVLRMELKGQSSFHDILQQTRTTCLKSYRHSDLPFEKIVELLHPVRDPSRHPIIQAIFQLRKKSDQQLSFPELTAHRFPVKKRTGNFDLHMVCEETETGIDGFLYYPQDLFSDSMMANFSKHYQILLKELIANPQRSVTQFPFLTEAETQQQLVDWNATAMAYPREQSLPGLFEAQASTTPDAVAVVSGEQQLTYEQVNIRANQLAHHLQRQGVGPEVRVGVCLERGLDLIVSLLAILKTGGAYVPLDPGYPKERLAYMLTDAHPAVLLTQQSLLEDLPSYEGTLVCLDTAWPSLKQESPSSLRHADIPDNLAYVIYTSGSTGRPKGVMISHRGICNHMEWMCQAFPLTETDCVIQKTPFSFDASVWEFFAPLLAGARLALAGRDGHRDPSYLIKLIAEQNATVLQMVPSLFRQLLEEGLASCVSLLYVFCGGEVLPRNLSIQWRDDSPAKLINLYGPTETTIDVFFGDGPVAEDSTIVPVGRPVANTQGYVVDHYSQLVPMGVPGELYIGGQQVARGYLHQPALTAEKFVPHPFSQALGARVYKTGDQVRWRDTGVLEFLGRQDNQIKLRGYRIELGEIEAVLTQHPAVAESVILVREDEPEDKRVVAYVVPAEELLSPSDLRQFLKQTLPEYMVPASFVMLDALPLTPNGKVDRRALPAPEEGDRTQGMTYEAPRTPIEETMAAIWQEVLGLERVGVHDNFFELGGHSLLATQVVSRVREQLLVELKLTTFFEVPTINGLANNLELLQGASQKPQESSLDPKQKRSEVLL